MDQKVEGSFEQHLVILHLQVLSLHQFEDDARHELARNMAEQGPPGRGEASPVSAPSASFNRLAKTSARKSPEHPETSGKLITWAPTLKLISRFECNSHE